MAAKTRETAESVWDAVALIELPAKKYFKIGEVAALVGVEPHVLRYWQTQFRQVRPQKSRSGHRQYRRRDVENLLAIKELLHVQRFTIAGARQALKSAPSTLPRPAADSTLPQPAQARAAESQPAPAPHPAMAPESAREVEAPRARREAEAPQARREASSESVQAPLSGRDDVAEFEVVGLETDSQLRRALEGEFAEQIGAHERVDVRGEAKAEPAPSTQETLSSATPPSSRASNASSNGTPSNGEGGRGSSGASAPAEAPTSNASANRPAPEVDLEVPRRRRSLVSQQLGFGFVPTAHEVLTAARREALELLELLDREDAADRRHLHSKV